MEKMIKLSFQQEQIMEYLKKHGSITQMQATNDLGITKLATRISETRRMGMTLPGETVREENRFGKIVPHTVYRLEA
jgi:hypothetical protein